MRSYSAEVLALLASGQLAKVTLVKFEFPGGTVGLNSSTWPLVYAGDTYLGAAGLGSVEPLKDSPGQLPGAKLDLHNVDTAAIALALDEADEVQGAPVTIRTALIETVNYTVVDAPIDWAGKCDRMYIEEDGEKGVIGVSAESKGVDLLRGHPLVYNDADQQSLVPGDRIFEYVVSQSAKPVVWPAREWFFK